MDDNSTVNFEDIENLIADYQHDTYLSEEPYAFLTSIPDELTRQRVIIAMRNKAKECGIKVADFDRMVKSALADKKRIDAEKAKEERKNRREAIIDDADSETELILGLKEKLGGNTPNFGKYFIKDNRVMYVDGFGTPQEVCSHIIFPSMRYINIETNNELLNISYVLDNRWKELRLIERKTIIQSKSIVSLGAFGLDITSENAKEVVNYLAEVDHLNRDIIPRRETVNHLGWVDGRGFSPYIDGIDYDSGGKFDEAFRSVHTQGSFDEWKALASKIMTDKQYRPSRIVLAASVASVVLRWTSQQPFIVHLWSTESGTGKTIATMLAASVWADPELGKYIRSMNATKVANEQLAGFCNNMPMILDELQTVQRSTGFDEIIYMLAEGTGKARGTKDGGLREQPHWMNTIITNGEQPISTNSRAGAVNRVISIEADGEIIPGGKKGMSEYADALRNNYGHAGRMIVKRLSQVNAPEVITEFYKNAMTRLSQTATGKQANYGAALLVGDILLNTIVFENAFPPLEPDDILPYLATADMVDTNQKALDWLIGFVASNSSKFHVEGKGAGSDNKSELLGKITVNGDVLILKNVLNQYMMREGYVMMSFLKWCYQRDYIKTNHSRNNRHWEVYTHIDGLEVNSVPVIHFKENVFSEEEN